MREPRLRPVLLILALLFAVLVVPNLAAQWTDQTVVRWILLVVQVYNFAILLLVVFLFPKLRHATWPLTTLACLSLCLADFVRHFSGMPSIGAYLSLTHTNPGEALEYLRMKWVAVAGVISGGALFALAFRALAARVDAGPLPRVRKPILCACLCLIASGSIWDALANSRKPNMPSRFADPLNNSFPCGFVFTSWDIAKHVRYYRHPVAAAPYHARRTVPISGRETYVLVIGESASAAYCSLSGYAYPTNALMKRRQDSGSLIYFPRVLAQANATMLALPMIVTPKTPSTFTWGTSNSLVTAFKEAGFTTYWISNQGEMGPTSEADFPLLLHPLSSYWEVHYDEDILPYLDIVLHSTREKKLIVLHLLGSHVLYTNRVPPSFKTPGLEGDPQEVAYARTLSYTDHVLDKVIHRLEGASGRSLLWYVSDHGQRLEKGEVGHGSLVANIRELHVPMLLWRNQEFAQANGEALARVLGHKDEILSQGVTFNTFLGLAGLTYDRRHGALAGTPRAENSQAPRFPGAPFDQVRAKALG